MTLVLSGSGCCSMPVGSSCGPNVFVLQGTGGYWPCIERFEKSLSDEGICTTVARPEQYPALADDIAQARECGRMRGPIVIVGYSLGAVAAIQLCRHLEDYGIAVDKLVLLESSYDAPLPANVSRCFNIYQSRPKTDWLPAFRGVPVSAESPATQVVNYDLREEEGELCCRGNHFTICTNPYVQDVMVDEILSVAGRGEEEEFDHNHVVWESPADLKTRFWNRIVGTIGMRPLNPKP